MATKKKSVPSPAPRVASALLRMDRASGLKAGTSLKQTKKIKYPGSGSAVGFDFLLRQHMIAQNQASAKVIAKARGSK